MEGSALSVPVDNDRDDGARWDVAGETFLLARHFSVNGD
jgi:hypothetical protein